VGTHLEILKHYVGPEVVVKKPRLLNTGVTAHSTGSGMCAS
jgi:hypothetical protein